MLKAERKIALFVAAGIARADLKGEEIARSIEALEGPSQPSLAPAGTADQWAM